MSFKKCIRDIAKLMIVSLVILCFWSTSSNTVCAANKKITFQNDNTTIFKDTSTPKVLNKAVPINSLGGSTPAIESDGTFSFSTDGSAGRTVTSTTFKVSSTSATVKARASSNYSSYTIYLEKYTLGLWPKVGTVKYYTGGKYYSHTFKNLSKSAKYRLRIYCEGRVDGSGSISNFVNP